MIFLQQIRIHNRSTILSYPSFETKISQRNPSDPENSLKKKKKKISPKSPNPIQSYRSSISEKQVARECLEHPFSKRQSSARLGILLARGSKDEGGSSTANEKTAITRGEKRREEWGGKEPSQIQLIEYRSPPPPPLSFFSRSLRKQLTRLPGQTVRFEQFMKRPDISLAAALLPVGQKGLIKFSVKKECRGKEGCV